MRSNPMSEQDREIIQNCVERLERLSSAFDTLGMAVVVNEIDDIGYLVRKVFELEMEMGEEQSDE